MTMNKTCPIDLIRKGYGYLIFGTSSLQSAFLLGVRLVWGYELFEAGSGKLLHIEKPISYFTSLGIPFPVQNTYLVGGTEMFGGVFLALGLFSRLAAIPLIINFIVAYITTEQAALQKLIHFDPDAFISADPFTYLLASVIVFIFGPGAYSVDGVLKRVFSSEPKSKIMKSPISLAPTR
jgi:putative oxidoreductase